MAISPLNATSAYTAATRSALDARAEGGAAGAAGMSDGGFAALVRNSLKEAVATGKQSEEMSLKGLAGEADLRDVVLAVNNAENALNTVVSVRDKVVTAYQEILKMPI